MSQSGWGWNEEGRREKKKTLLKCEEKEKELMVFFHIKKLNSITRKGTTAGFSLVIFCSHNLSIVKYDHVEANGS